MNIIALCNLKGGVGKTTSAIGLATAAARKGYKVRVLDTDPQGSACSWANTAEQQGTPLSFPVESANVAVVESLPRTASDDDWVFIDCPPSGNVQDAAVEVCDFAVIPTGHRGLDLKKSYKTAKTVSRDGVPYAFLLTLVRAQTNSLQATSDAIAEGGYSCFDTTIPLREGVANTFGSAWSGDLFRYDEAFDELEEALS